MFGLGSSSYPSTFGAFGRQVDNQLSALGGDRMLPLRVGDEARGGQGRAFRNWMADVARELGMKREEGDQEHNGKVEEPAEWKACPKPDLDRQSERIACIIIVHTN